MKFSSLALVVFTLALLGCSSTRRLHVEEQALDTDGPITNQFHSALYYPFEITPRFDGYLVGIEKVRRPQEAAESVKNRPEYGLTDDALKKKFSDGKVMAVTHVIRHFADARQFENCTIFNAYVQSAESSKRQLVRPCDMENHVPSDPSKAFSNSWIALDGLKADIARRIQARPDYRPAPQGPERRAVEPGSPYSHIVVVVMGWNTVQEEAVRNMNSLVWNLLRAHPQKTGSSGPDSAFNPLVIGVTWPSQWSSAWLDPAVKVISFPTKAGDADEVGMSWLGVMLHDTLPKGLPVVVIGHSFGAKATSVAACAGPAVVRTGTEPVLPLGNIDVVVNLEPAYLSERIFGRSSWLQNVVYPAGCLNVDRFVLTASRSDEAVPLPFWGAYMGEGKSYKKFCSAGPDRSPLVSCLVADVQGAVKAEWAGSTGISYVDASDLISENAYGTGGGSHSDIYRREHGRFIYDIVMRNQPWTRPIK